VQARLTNGAEVYPYRPDLAGVMRWRCDACGCHVGTHSRHPEPEHREKPLGVIPSAEMRAARIHIHRLVDPFWKNGKVRRKDIYAHIAKALGVAEYHTGELRTIDEARRAYAAAADFLLPRRPGQ
jgi:hypothetical protein